MKGKIELFYALPNIGAYLEKKGIPEQHFKPLIQMLVELDEHILDRTVEHLAKRKKK